MSTAKDELKKLIDEQPDDSSYEDLAKEIAFAVMVRRGLEDSDAGRVISNEDMQRQIRSWCKQTGPTSHGVGSKKYTTSL